MGKIALILILVIGICFLLLKIITLLLRARTKNSNMDRDAHALLNKFHLKYFNPNLTPDEFIKKLQEIADPETSYTLDDKKIAQELLDFHHEEELIKNYLSQAATKQEWYAKLHEIADDDRLYTAQERITAKALRAKTLPK